MEAGLRAQSLAPAARSIDVGASRLKASSTEERGSVVP